MTRCFQACVLFIISVILLAGCLMTANKTVKKTGPSQTEVKGIASKSESKKGRIIPKKLETDEEKPTSPERRSNSKKGDSKPEEQEVRIMAKDLAKTYPNVKKAKVCYDSREDEWWITLYEDHGYYCELRQYVWSFTENDLNKFLRVERVSKKKLDRHLAKKLPGKRCQVVEIEPKSSSEPATADLGETAQRVVKKKTRPAVKKPEPRKEAKPTPKTLRATKKVQTKTEARSKVRPEPERQRLSKAVASPLGKIDNTGRTRTKAESRKQVKTAPKRQTPAGSVPSASRTAEKTSRPNVGTDSSSDKTRRAEVRRPISKPTRPPAEKKEHHVESKKLSQAAPSRSEHTRVSKPKTAEGKLEKPPIPSHRASRTITTYSDVGSASNAQRGKPARPGSSEVPTFHVFVYGSELKHQDLLIWLEDKGYDSSLILDAKPAKLKGYDYVWNYYSPSRDGGAVNLEPKGDSTVWGLLIEAEDSLLKAFDDKQGHPSFYTRSDKRIRVERAGDGAPVFAWIYLAQPNKGGRRDVWPSETYKGLILEGARFWRFPDQHIEKLKKWQTR